MGMPGYDGDAISENEWDEADRESLDRAMEEPEPSTGTCLICGELKDANGHCECGCNIED